jgi:tetratricopeptide (TPR) repeat protein
MKSENQIKQFAKDIRIKPDAGVDERILAFAEAILAKSTKNQDVAARRHPSIRRKIMKSPITKLAAAAVMLIGVFVLTSIFVETNTSVVLAGVLDKVERARAFMYKMEMTTTGSMMPGGKHEVQGTMIISDEYGMKWEMDIPDPNTGEKATTEMYILPDQKVAILLMPEQKKYQRMEFDDDWFARVKREKNDPRETLKRMMDCNYTELGRKEIDGIEVEGFETTDLKFSEGVVMGVKVTLWVDVKTWLPVLWKMDIEKNELMEIHAVLSDFEWDIPVVASDFEPVIPADYTAMIDDGYKRPSMSEKAALGSRVKSTATDYYERGEAHYLDGEYDLAFSEFTKAIEIDPMLARAYVIRGMAYNDKGEHDLAIADFTKVIEIRPTDARAYVYRGMAYENKGEYDLAIADYSKAIEIDPTIADAYRGRAHAYTYKGEYDKAWKDIYEAQALGHPVDSKLLEKLRQASGRDE